MKAQKIFTKILARYYKQECVCIVTSYDKARKLLKLILSLPETKIVGITLNSAEWDGYCQAYLITIDEEGQVFCEKAINSRDNKPFRGEGYYIIDESAIDGYRPEDFFYGECRYKVV